MCNKGRVVIGAICCRPDCTGASSTVLPAVLSIGGFSSRGVRRKNEGGGGRGGGGLKNLESHRRKQEFGLTLRLRLHLTGASQRPLALHLTFILTRFTSFTLDHTPALPMT